MGPPAVILGVLYFLAGVGCYGAVRLGHTEWFYLSHRHLLVDRPQTRRPRPRRHPAPAHRSQP